MANLLARDDGPLAPVTEPIYHYTSAQGLTGALGSRRLWASQATSLNDHAEVRQGWDLIVETIRHLLTQHPGDGELSALLSWAERPMDKAQHVGVLCASLRGDDANQWRLYGGGSRGYAIELDPSVVMVATADGGAPPPPSPGSGIVIDFDVFFVSEWFRVIYTRAELTQAVHDLWTAYASATPPPDDPTLSAEDQYAAHSDWWHDVSAVALSELATLAHLFKTEGFAGEHEVRKVVRNLKGPSHMRYRPGFHGVVAYHELAAAPSGHAVHQPCYLGDLRDPLPHLPVVSVRLGPLAPEGHEETVRDYLDSEELQAVNVTRSEVPLR